MWKIVLTIKLVFIMLFIQLPLELIGIPMVAIGVLFMKREDEHMPKLFKWWDYLDGLPTPSNGKTYDEKYDQSIVDRGGDMYGYTARFGWYIRNQMDYFNRVIMGVANDKKVKWIQVKAMSKGVLVEPEEIGDREGHISGYRYIEIEREGERYFEIYWIRPYKLIMWDLCFRVRLGYKLWGSSGPYGLDHKYYQLVISINPVFPFRGTK